MNDIRPPQYGTTLKFPETKAFEGDDFLEFSGEDWLGIISQQMDIL